MVNAPSIIQCGLYAATFYYGKVVEGKWAFLEGDYAAIDQLHCNSILIIRNDPNNPYNGNPLLLCPRCQNTKLT